MIDVLWCRYDITTDNVATVIREREAVSIKRFQYFCCVGIDSVACVEYCHVAEARGSPRTTKA